MDVFHPRFVEDFLEPVLLRNMKEIKQGYWLEGNTPYVTRNMHPTMEPLSIPYRPGNGFNSTLKETSTHLLANDTSV